MTNSPNAMPGAFNFHPREAATVAPPRLSGAKSHIFQPPRTPSASASSSLVLTRSTASVMSLSSTGGSSRPKFAARKRTLEDYNGGTETPRNGDGYDWEVRGGLEDTGVAEGWIPSSPAPFVNTRYQLAGGMDTPNLAAARDAELGVETFSDVGYRRSLGEEVERPILKDSRTGLFGEHEGQSYFPMQEEFDREANGRVRSNHFEDSPRGAWSKAAISVVEGVVGKVWEFCKHSSTIFSGFHAGGGTGYKINPDDATPNFDVIEEHNRWHEKNERESTPLPGQFPREDLDFIPDYMDNPTPEHTPPRPSKRRQVSGNNTDELARNWVVVPPTTSTPTPSKSHIRAPARYSMPTSSSSARRSVLANTSSHRPASRAGLPRPKPALAPRVSHAGSPALNPARGASFASPRSPGPSVSPSTFRIPRASGSPARAVESPAAKEAARWAALKKKEEREQDESLRRLDRQLKDLIREGKEALGTRVEVEVEDDRGQRQHNHNSPTRKWAF